MSFLLYKRSKTIAVMGQLTNDYISPSPFPLRSVRYMIRNYGLEHVFPRSSFIRPHNLAVRAIVNHPLAWFCISYEQFPCSRVRAQAASLLNVSAREQFQLFFATTSFDDLFIFERVGANGAFLVIAAHRKPV